jgi:LPS sulfotransferase NodH
MQVKNGVAQRGLRFLRLLFLPSRHPSLDALTPNSTVLVLSFPRSGTSWLGSVMENFGSPFTYYGELFAAISEAPGLGVVSANYPGFRWTYLRAFLKQRAKWSMKTFEDFGMSSSSVLKIMKSQPGVNVVKVFPRHLSDETIAAHLKEFQPHVLFLRRNHRDRFISIERAKHTGEWQNAQYADVDISIDEVVFERFRSGAEAWYREQKQLCISLGLTVSDVSYEELQDPVRLRSLLQELTHNTIAIDENHQLSSTLTKQGSTNADAKYQFAAWIPADSN